MTLLSHPEARRRIEDIDGLLNQNKVSEAIDAIEAADALDPLSEADLIDLALHSRRAGKREFVYKYLTRARDAGSKSEIVLFELGLSEMDLSRYHQAAESFSRLTKQRPKRAEYWQWKARSLGYINGPRDEIVAAYREALRLEPANEHHLKDLLRFAINDAEHVREVGAFAESCALSPHGRQLLGIFKAVVDDELDRAQRLTAAEAHIPRDIDRGMLAGLQLFCREIFIDPLVANLSASLSALHLFFDLARRIETSFGYKPLLASIDQACRQLPEFIRESYATGTVVLVQTSSQYFSAFKAWYHLYKDLKGDSRLLVVALDARAVDLIVEHYPQLVRCVYLVPVFPEVRLTYGNSQERTFYWYIKVNIARAVLEAGRNVVITDADAFWKRDLALLIDYEFNALGSDLVCQQEGGLPRAIAKKWGFSICAGLWAAKSSPKIIQFMDRLLDYTLLLWDDQVGLNTLILDGTPTWSGEASKRRTGHIRLEPHAEQIAITALPEDDATRDIWQLDQVGPSAVHGQYYKHEEWANQAIFGDVVKIERQSFISLSVSDYKRVARHAFGTHNFGAAKKLLEICNRIDPRDQEVLLNLGIANLALKDPNEAISRLKALTELEPRHLHGLMWLGLAHVDIGALDEAYGYFEKATDYDPSHSNAYLQKALILRQQGRIDQARETARTALTRSLDNQGTADALRQLVAELSDPAVSAE